MKRTDVWSENMYVFKMQGAGYHAESQKPNALNPLKMGKSFCHEPLQTNRTHKPFLQVGGNQLATQHNLSLRGATANLGGLTTNSDFIGGDSLFMHSRDGLREHSLEEEDRSLLLEDRSTEQNPLSNP